MALSDDLRKRVVEAVVLGGLSRNSAASSELSQRLIQEFPIGSSASRLSDSLSEQGFRAVSERTESTGDSRIG